MRIVDPGDSPVNSWHDQNSLVLRLFLFLSRNHKAKPSRLTKKCSVNIVATLAHRKINNVPRHNGQTGHANPHHLAGSQRVWNKFRFHRRRAANRLANYGNLPRSEPVQHRFFHSTFVCIDQIVGARYSRSTNGLAFVGPRSSRSIGHELRRPWDREPHSRRRIRSSPGFKNPQIATQQTASPKSKKAKTTFLRKYLLTITKGKLRKRR